MYTQRPMLYEAYMGPTWGRQDPGESHVGHMNLATREALHPHCQAYSEYNVSLSFRKLPKLPNGLSLYWVSYSYQIYHDKDSSKPTW